MSVIQKLLMLLTISSQILLIIETNFNCKNVTYTLYVVSQMDFKYNPSFKIGYN